MNRENEVKLRRLFTDAEVSIRDARYYYNTLNFANCLINLTAAIKHATSVEDMVRKEQERGETDDK